MQGTPEKQALLNNQYQALSKVPLLIGFDGEWGLDMRLKNTFRYPWNMALGAVSDTTLIQQFGERLEYIVKGWEFTLILLQWLTSIQIQRIQLLAIALLEKTKKMSPRNPLRLPKECNKQEYWLVLSIFQVMEIQPQIHTTPYRSSILTKKDWIH